MLQLWLALIISALAAFVDVRKGVIPNWLTYSAVLIGFVLPVFDVDQSHASTLVGFLIGFFVPFLLYISGKLGGGDLKLFAALGALLGYPLIISLILWSCVTGFLVAIFYTIINRRSKEVALALYELIVVTFVNKMGPTPAPLKGHKIPLGLGIFLAAMIMVLFPDRAMII